MGKTFKELEKDRHIDKEIKKSGLSLAIIFSKEEIKRLGLKYGDKIRMDNAEIL